jgi:hypothetical protein
MQRLQFSKYDTLLFGCLEQQFVGTHCLHFQRKDVYTLTSVPTLHHQISHTLQSSSRTLTLTRYLRNVGKVGWVFD